MTLSYTVKDLINSLLPLFLFPLVLVFPGYITGWFINAFNFKQRQIIVQFGIGLVLSFAISPIYLFLTSQFLSLEIAYSSLLLFAIFAIIVFFKKKPRFYIATNKFQRLVFWACIIWVTIAIFSLVDLQWNDQLYYSVVSRDHATRIAITDAMTRTGVPPNQPGYYPGRPVKLTYLYHFWYILVSAVDWLGGPFVDARMAFIASAAWCGLGLMATIALYIRLRNPVNSFKAWKSTFIGICSLSISGLDVIPTISFFLFSGQYLVADMELWNTQITAWFGSILWVPLHVASMIAGLVAIMLVQSIQNDVRKKAFQHLTIAGIAFASAIGLSSWVTLVFVAFWVIWIVLIFIKNQKDPLIIPMVYTGIIALILASPFLAGIIQANSSGNSGQFPISFEVRVFSLVKPFVETLPKLSRSLAMLVVLPINYFFELGFFLIAGIFWLKKRNKLLAIPNNFFQEEFLLLIVVVLFGSFIRSTILFNNDLGWRAWLPGQFILLIWGVDIFENLFFTSHLNKKIPEKIKAGKVLLIILALLGILTSTLDMFYLRFAWPMSGNEELGRRTYSARLAYDYMRNNIPSNAIVQPTPLNVLDRPSGLYNTHQMVVNDLTYYGIPIEDVNALIKKTESLFTQPFTELSKIDIQCQNLSIDILIYKDTDPAWDSLDKFETERPSIYKNDNYALFACGDYATP